MTELKWKEGLGNIN